MAGCRECIHFNVCEFAWDSPMSVGCSDFVEKSDVVTVGTIKNYLQKKLDEWDALGDRKWEPANIWGYNFIMACLDDMEAYRARMDGDSQ